MKAIYLKVLHHLGIRKLKPTLLQQHILEVTEENWLSSIYRRNDVDKMKHLTYNLYTL
jgi:hypothetical protein